MATVCTPEDLDEDLCIANPQPDLVCIEIYEPVCGCDNITYSNECYATAAGVQEWVTGQCN